MGYNCSQMSGPCDIKGTCLNNGTCMADDHSVCVRMIGTPLPIVVPGLMTVAHTLVIRVHVLAILLTTPATVTKVCVYVCVCMCVCVRACVRACVWMDGVLVYYYCIEYNSQYAYVHTSVHLYTLIELARRHMNACNTPLSSYIPSCWTRFPTGNGKHFITKARW